MENAFEEFPKIARLNRPCLITEKIDGTNAQVYFPEDDGPMLCGSRNRWLTGTDDNFGFAAWCRQNEAGLRKLLGHGRHYGEWWGAGIQRRYDLKEKHFSLFNALRWRGVLLTQTEVPNIGVVPVLYEGLFTTDAVKSAIERLRVEGSMAKPGFMRPEGVVIYHNAAGVGFKVTLEKDEQPKGIANG